jgi:hypothetical protein
MNKELINKVLNILNETDKAYVRLIREYGTIQHTAAANSKVRKYVKDIKDMALNDVNTIINTEKEAIKSTAKVKPGIRDLAAELRRNNELTLMKSSIDGASKEQLIELASKYGNTEYEEDFRTIIQPKLNALINDKTPERLKNIEVANGIIATLDKLPDETIKDIELLENIQNDVNSMFNFNKNSFNIAAQPNEQGRIIHGNFNTRSIEYDISNADENFNPLNADLEPLVVTEKMGLKSYKTVKYQYDWDEN